MVTLNQYHLVKGEVVTLTVVSPKDYPRFLPVFLHKGNDAHVPMNERSARFPQVAYGVCKPIINEGEIWQAKIVALKLDKLQNLTKDGRRRLIVFLKNFKRIEQTVKRLINNKIGCIEIWSGTHLINRKKVDLYPYKEGALSGDKVIVTTYYYEMDEGLFKKVTVIHHKNEFIRDLQQAGINPVNYLKKLSVSDTDK